MWKVTYCKMNEQFHYHTLPEREVEKVVGPLKSKTFKKPAETIHDGMNGAVEVSGDKILIRTVPGKGQLRLRVLEIHPASHLEADALRSQYAEKLKSKLPVLATPYAIAQLEITEDGSNERGKYIDFDLYEEGLNFVRTIENRVNGQKQVVKKPLFIVEELNEQRAKKAA